MKFLVYGGNGWLGSDVCGIIKEAGDELEYGSRVSAYSDVQSDIEHYKPDFVICSLGRTYGPGFATIDYLEQPGKLQENLLCNLTAPLYISQATAETETKKAIPTLYLGSGCIFEYDQWHPIGGAGFTEEDTPNFTGSSYSTVKGHTDQLLNAFPHVITARIRMPIGEEDHPRDFITKILGYKKIVSIPNSMTILSDFLPFLIAALVEGKRGIINATNPGAIDHETILQMYEEETGKKHDYTLMTLEEQSTMLLAGRSNNFLETTKAERWWNELSPETKLKYKVPENLRSITERVSEIVHHRVTEDMMAPPENTRRVLVTGGAGFIGSNFMNYWMKKYPNDFVLNFDSLEASANLKNIEDSENPNYKFIRGDILDKITVNRIFKRYAFTHVIHFAAMSHVDQSFALPVKCTNVNVLGTHVVLEAIRLSKHKLELFVFASTDEVYGDTPEGASLENTTFLPTNPYAATKAGAECLIMSYGKSYHLPYMVTRSNNVYGHYQCQLDVIPHFTLNLLRGEKMPVQGGGTAARRFVHVMDFIRATDLMMHNGVLGEVYNIGSNDEISVNELCALLLKLVREKDERLSDWVDHVPDRPYQDSRYSVDYTKILSLGWKPEVPFQEGLRELVEWCKKNQHRWPTTARLPAW